MKKILKPIIIAVCVALVGFGAYAYIAKKKNADQGTLISSNAGASTPTNESTESEDISNHFLDLLLNLKNIRLDTSLFDAATFKALQDFSSPISPDPNPGRPNPFSPIGQDVVTVSSFSVTTNPVSTMTSTTATLSATLSPGTIAIERYFEWGTTNTTPLTNVTIKVSQNTATGEYTYGLTGLVANTTYYMRAVAKVGSTVIYGSVVSFKTPLATAGGI